MGWNECTDRKHMDNPTRYVLLSAYIMGGGENEEMHEVLYNLQAAERSLTAAPHILKTYYGFHCYQTHIFNENYKWFSGLYFRVGEAFITHR